MGVQTPSSPLDSPPVTEVAYVGSTGTDAGSFMKSTN